MRVAETRAVNRSLRKAYGIGVCSVEEMGSFASPSPNKVEAKNETRKLPRQPVNGNRIHEYRQKKPLTGIGTTAAALKLSIPTVTVALNHLVNTVAASECSPFENSGTVAFLDSPSERRSIHRRHAKALTA
jgi:hypothetical protein